VLDKGDVMLMYTDGLMEAMDPEGNQYTGKRLAEDLVALHHRSAEEIAHAIIERVQRFGARGKNQDDKTIVVVKRFAKSNTDISP
jgi:sigma-B regulation protein RsbU (phosphoserine phosphatase)